MIRIENIAWSYPHSDSASLRGVELTVAPGEFVVLCGASGSGKSTTLRLLDGLIPHFYDDGVLIGSVLVNGLRTAEHSLDEIGLVTGTVLQHPRRQFFTDRAADEIGFAMENFGFSRDRIRAHVDDALATLASGVPVGQPLSAMSGGQQQQVALAAATAHNPSVLLLDEPSSNLSSDAVARLVRTLAQLKAKGVTIVVAEHRLRYLQDLLDRVVVMRDGAVDVVWSASEFCSISDETLAREGLRGDTRSPELAEVSACGKSVASPSFRAAPTPALRLEGVRCRLGGRTVLDLDEATFAASEVTAIRGVNGAGKTTLARIITGLQRSAGTVRLGGLPLSRRARQRMSAIVMQDVQRQLFTDSVKAEIELAAAESSQTTAVTSALEALGLAHLAERHPLSLSGGEQQRLVIAAVRLSGRKVVVFDEPSSGVDRRHLQSIADQIRQVAADGAVVLLISHDDDLLSLAADRQLTLVPVEAVNRDAGAIGRPGAA